MEDAKADIRVYTKDMITPLFYGNNIKYLLTLGMARSSAEFFASEGGEVRPCCPNPEYFL